MLNKHCSELRRTQNLQTRRSASLINQVWYFMPRRPPFSLDPRPRPLLCTEGSSEQEAAPHPPRDPVGLESRVCREYWNICQGPCTRVTLHPTLLPKERGATREESWHRPSPPPTPPDVLCPRESAETQGRHLWLAAGPSWLAGILAPPESSQPSLYPPHLLPWQTGSQERSREPPPPHTGPIPVAGPLPPLPPPWVARPLPCLLCPRCQKSRWAGLLAGWRLNSEHMAGGTQHPAVGARGAAAGTAPGAGRGAGQVLTPGSTPVPLLLGCRLGKVGGGSKKRDTSSHWGLSQAEAWRLGQF